MLNQQTIINILQILLPSLEDENFIWRLDGSGNLLIQGVDTPVNDLDICTTEQGLKIFRKKFQKYFVKEFFKPSVDGQVLILNIQNSEVEILARRTDELNMFDKIQSYSWQGFSIPILPLVQAQKFYKMIEKKPKVELIKKHLSRKNQK